jgi:hypothetical protein
LDGYGEFPGSEEMRLVRSWEGRGAKVSKEEVKLAYQEPGTDWMTMLCSWTPEASSLAFAPARRGSMIWCGVCWHHLLAELLRGERRHTVMFHRACTMAMRRPLPSCCCASPGPFNEAMLR